jgi:hypothetical protein
MNKLSTSIIALAGILAASISQAQTPGSLLGVADQVNGSITVTSTNINGCPTRVCTTNEVTNICCFTNTFWKLVCTTNSAGAINCTNVLVTETRCFTNTFPEIRCTNEFLTPTSLAVKETLTGPLTELSCDQLSPFLPSNTVFQANLFLNVRTNDWLGTQFGFFKILSGTNVLATGSLTGVTGVPCGECNQFGGVLHGILLVSGPLHGASLEAEYGGSLSGVACPSMTVPQGSVALVIHGVAVVPCSSGFGEKPIGDNVVVAPAAPIAAPSAAPAY